MSDRVRVLIVEDVPTDAELMEYELQNAGMAFSAKRVETKAVYIEALSTFLPDVILSDYSLPAFDGITALQLRLERAPDTPFIFVTGALGEELAIELLKRGATDYVLKAAYADFRSRLTAPSEKWRNERSANGHGPSLNGPRYSEGKTSDG